VARRRTAEPTGRLPPGECVQVWLAAIHPQTPSVPRTKRLWDFGRRGGDPEQHPEGRHSKPLRRRTITLDAGPGPKPQ
jgi:hypothetical protein